MKRVFNKSRLFQQYLSFTTATTATATATATATGTSIFLFAANAVEPTDPKPNKNNKNNKLTKRKNDNMSSETPLSDRVKGHYENRIRQYSTYEKIFSTFASKTDESGKISLMTFHDFREAILPYDYRAIEKRRCLANPPLFLKKIVLTIDNPHNVAMSDKIDCDSVGVITLSEFIFMVSLLGIKPSDFEVAFNMFDLDENGTMSSREFMELMKNFSIASTSAYDPEIIRKSALWTQLFSKNKEFFKTLETFQKFPEISHTPSMMLSTTTSTTTTTSQSKDDNKGERGKKGKKRGESELELREFGSFLLNLRESILLIEFDRYLGCDVEYDINNYEDLNKQRISAKDFAWSLVSYAKHKDIAYYKAKIARMPVKKKKMKDVSWQEFRDFNMCLGYIDDIVHCLKLYASCKHEISQKAFKRACKVVCDMDLSDNLVNIIFWVFDRDQDGTLDYDEIVGLLESRFAFGNKRDRTVGFTKFMQCFGKCFRSTAAELRQMYA